MPPTHRPAAGVAATWRPLRWRPLAVAAGLTACVLGFVSMATPAGAVRVMDWNVLNFSGTSGIAREPQLRLVINAINPDLLITEEMTGSGAAGPTEFLNNVLNFGQPGTWAMGTFTNGPDTDNACFYKVGLFSETGHLDLTTALRQIDGWTMRPAGYTAASTEIHIYAMHLKASQGFEADRAAEATILRNHLNTLPAGSNIFSGGDLNLYGVANEPAWNIMTGSQADNDGQLFDPINRVGEWQDNLSFMDVWTQSTRSDNVGDGGATGGLDDRFDFLLANDDLLDGQGMAIVPGTYRAYGNDGQHHNNSINVQPNTAVSPEIADALHFVSDHLPLFMDVQLPAIMVTSGTMNFGGALVGTNVVRTLTVQNPTVAPADALDYSLATTAGFSTPPGPFSLAAGGSAPRSISMDTSAPGNRLGTVTVSGDAPDNPSDGFSATGTVYAHAVPSTVAEAQILGGALDFGSHVTGEFTDQPAEAHNFGYGSFQALLEVYDTQIGGADAARFSVVSFAPTAVGSTPASFDVHFDDAGTTENTAYTASLILFTRDQQGLEGAAEQPAIVYDLSAFVQSSTVAAPGISVARTLLYQNVPNPFNPATTISFDLAHAGHVRLSVYDARGRTVGVLVDEERVPGRYHLVWNGRGSDGAPVASGVYFCKLSADAQQQVMRLTLVR